MVAARSSGRLPRKPSSVAGVMPTAIARTKRDFRRLWIVRINAAARLHDMSYNAFINGLHASGIEVDRKVLADLAVREPEAFAAIAEQAKKALDAKVAAA